MSQSPGIVSSRFLVLLAGSGLLLVGGLIAAVLFRSPVGAVIAAVCVIGAWFVSALLAVRYRDRAKLLSLASKADIRSVIEKVDETRAKESRHEYHQERSLHRIENSLRRVHVLSAGGIDDVEESELDILFVTSNGAGLGHLSRLSAIAKQLPADRSIEFLTMSTAYERMADSGYTVHYFPSGGAVGEPPEVWNPMFQWYFQKLVHRLRPRLVVFDGTWVYKGITDVCRTFGISLVWVQRGMWRRDVDENSVQRHNARSVVDHVIVPGDYAGTETVDVGKGIDPHYVGPVVMTESHEIVARHEACMALGLDPNGKYVLLNLGGGSISDPDSIAHEAFALLRENAAELTPVQVVSPLAELGECTDGLIRVSAYPVMRYAKAFEAMIAAAGYNTAQEAVSLGVPSILVPNLNTITDDQSRRAHLLSERGLCWAVDESSDMTAAIKLLADPNERRRMRERLDEAESPSGAVEAASIVDDILRHSEWPKRAVTLDKRGG